MDHQDTSEKAHSNAKACSQGPNQRMHLDTVQDRLPVPQQASEDNISVHSDGEGKMLAKVGTSSLQQRTLSLHEALEVAEGNLSIPQQASKTSTSEGCVGKNSALLAEEAKSSAKTLSIGQHAGCSPSVDINKLMSPEQATEDASDIMVVGCKAASFHPRTEYSLVSHLSRSLEASGAEVHKHLRTVADCLEAGDHQAMIRLLDQLDLRTVTAPVTQCAILFGYGIAYQKLQLYHLAKPKLMQVQRLALEHAGDMIANASLALFHLGDICSLESDNEDACHWYSLAVKHYGTSTLAILFKVTMPSLSNIQMKLAASLKKCDRILQAVGAYRGAIALAKVAGDRRDEVSACTSLGNLLQGLGEYRGAIEEYSRAIALAEEEGDQVTLGWNYGNIGNAYLGLQKKDKALYYLHRCLEITLAWDPQPQSIGRAYNNLGIACQTVNDMEKALEYYQSALDQAIVGGDLAGQARVCGNLGNVCMAKKDYEQAYKYYSDVVHLTTDKVTKSSAYHNRGCCLYEQAEVEVKKGTPLPKVIYVGPDFSEEEGAVDLQRIGQTAKGLYEAALRDLQEFVNYYELTLHTLKGTTKGLTLSTSVFESSSRTFHRIQDCLVSLNQPIKALVVAEQSRARSLGELLLKRAAALSLVPPLTYRELCDIVRSQDCPVIFLSYTGARLLVWSLATVAENGSVAVNAAQVYLEGTLIDGMAFENFLGHTLPKLMVDENLFDACDYDQQSVLTALCDLVAEPLLRLLANRIGRSLAAGPEQVILIPDSYTVMPMVALRGATKGRFLGDDFMFRVTPSLLTMDVMNHSARLAEGCVVIRIPQESEGFCIVGDPSVPVFQHGGEVWSLGALPHAEQEASWVARAVQGRATLQQKATKGVVVSMLQSAKLIHLATHGSAASGFLAFAGFACPRGSEPADAREVLLFPHEVEQLSVRAALVVLSSCNSARGTVRADGIMGMARAFILAGAQSVLTTLWQVPDESAGMFVQFFYQFLIDGLSSSVALHRAILGVRCFKKYSHYVHWAAYQIIGKDIRFEILPGKMDGSLNMLTLREELSFFPRLSYIRDMETTLLADKSHTVLEILQSSYDLHALEVVLNLLHIHAKNFRTIVWINSFMGTNIQLPDQLVAEMSDGGLNIVVIDGAQTIQSIPENMVTLMKSTQTHVIFISSALSLNTTFTVLDREVRTTLKKGVSSISLMPMTVLQVTQRIVYPILSRTEIHFAPMNLEQDMFLQLADLSHGSPPVADLISRVVCHYYKSSDHPVQDITRDLIHPAMLARKNRLVTFVQCLIQGFRLSPAKLLILRALSTLGEVPIPRCIVANIIEVVPVEKDEQHLSATTINQFQKRKILGSYPPVVLKGPLACQTEAFEYFYVPHIVRDAVTQSMETQDTVFAISVAYTAIAKEVFSNACISSLGLYSALIANLLSYEHSVDLFHREIHKLSAHLVSSTHPELR